MRSCSAPGCGNLVARSAFNSEHLLDCCREHELARVLKKLRSEDSSEVWLRVKHVTNGVFAVLLETGGVITEDVVMLPRGSNERPRTRCFNFLFEGCVWSGRVHRYSIPAVGGSPATVQFDRTKKKRLPVKTKQEVEGTPLF